MNAGMDAGESRRLWCAMLVLALTGAVLLLPLGARRAEAFVYWMDSYRPNHIGRANLDGTGIAPEFIFIGNGHDASFFAPPDALAVDARFIYWSTAGTDSIGRARLDGGKVDRKFITGIETGELGGGIAVDDGHLYWAHGDCNIEAAGIRCTTGAIGRANLDGSSIEPSFIDGIHPLDVAVDAGHIYWTSAENTVGRANLDRTGVEQEFIDRTGWSSDFTEPVTAPTDLWVDAAHVYWADSEWPFITHPTAWIGRATLAGAPEPALGAPQATVSAMAVNGLTDTAPPQTTITDGAPHRTHKTELEFEFEASEPASTFECRRDSGKWKECDPPRRIAKLDRGEHRFAVRATDAAGNRDPTPAQDRFRVVP